MLEACEKINLFIPQYTKYCLRSVYEPIMHDPRKSDINSVARILRNLKSFPGNGLLFTKHKLMKVEGYSDAYWVGSLGNRYA